MDINKIRDLEVEGVDTRDYPDFCDAFFSKGFWIETGIELTDNELDQLGEEYPELLNVMAFESCIP